MFQVNFSLPPPPNLDQIKIYKAGGISCKINYSDIFSVMPSGCIQLFLFLQFKASILKLCFFLI